MSQNGVKKEIIDKINENYITKKEKESVSLFEIRQKQKEIKILMILMIMKKK